MKVCRGLTQRNLPNEMHRRLRARVRELSGGGEECVHLWWLKAEEENEASIFSHLSFV